MKVLVLVGSDRRDSYNAKLAELMTSLAPKSCEIVLRSVKDIPIYNWDVEQKGWPRSVARLRKVVRRVEAVVVVTPEYNGMISAHLLTAFEWLSRSGRKGENLLKSKLTAVAGATTGRIGTLRAQQHYQRLALNLGMKVYSGGSKLMVSDVANVIDNEEKKSRLRQKIRVFWDEFSGGVESS